MVLSTGPVAANAKLYQIDSRHASFYFSLMAAAGTLVASVAFIVFGKVSNRLIRLRGTNRRLLVMSLGLTPLFGFLLARAESLNAMLFSWCLLQLPAAAVISVATSRAFERLSGKRLTLISALFGASGVFALLLGALLGLATHNDLAKIFWLAFAISTCLQIPSAIDSQASELKSGQEERVGLRFNRPLVAALAAIFAAFCAMALSTDFYLQLSVRINGLGTQNTSIAYSLSSVSSLTFLVSTVLVGIISRATRHIGWLFFLSFPTLAIGLAFFASASVMPAAYIGAVFLGIGGGINVASQLPVLKEAANISEVYGGLSAAVNVASALPGVLVPLIAAILIRLEPKSWSASLAVGLVGLMCIAGTLILSNKTNIPAKKH